MCVCVRASKWEGGGVGVSVCVCVCVGEWVGGWVCGWEGVGRGMWVLTNPCRVFTNQVLGSKNPRMQVWIKFLNHREYFKLII